MSNADDRQDYGEQRMNALVPGQGRLYVVCYVIRDIDKRAVRRIISFRKANEREEKAYEQTTTD